MLIYAKDLFVEAIAAMIDRRGFRNEARAGVSGAALTTAVQDFDILLEGSRGYRFALLQQRDATTREIKAIVTRMADQAEVLELITRHRIGMNEVADVDQISLEELIERLGRVTSELQRRNRPLLKRGKRMGNKPLNPQLLIDLTKRRLPFVEIHKLQFRLDHYGIP